MNLNDDTTLNRRVVATGYDVNVPLSNVVAMERSGTRNVNYFTERTVSGQN